MKQLKPALLLFLLSLLAYWTFLSNPFLWDDTVCIAHNPFIKEFSNLWILLSPENLIRKLPIENAARPLLVASNLFDHLLWGDNPSGYRLFTLLLHALNAALVLRLGLRLGGSAWAGWTAAFLFALHPVHSENIAVVSFRSDVLCSLFMLAGFLVYLEYREAASPRSAFVRFALVCLLFWFALLSKEMALVFPLLLTAYEYSFGLPLLRPPHPQPERGSGNRFRLEWPARFRWDLLLLSGIACFYYLFRESRSGYAWTPPSVLNAAVESRALPRERPVSFPPSPPPWKDLQKSPSRNFFTMSRIFGDYLLLLVFPRRLQADYNPEIISDWRRADLLAAWLAWLFLAAVAWRFRPTHPQIAFAVFWLALSLLPVADLKPLYNIKAERYLYIPSIGFAALAALILEWMRNRLESRSKILKHLPAAALALILGAFAARLLARGRDWSSEQSLYESVLRVSPNVPRMHYNLGTLFQSRGLPEEAESAYKRALALKGDYFEALTNLGALREEKGLRKEALDYYRAALKYHPQSYIPYHNLARLLLADGRRDEAIRIYENSLEADPERAIAHVQLGELYRRKGDLDAARRHWENALHLAPDMLIVRQELADLYIRIGKPEEAARQSQSLHELSPGDPAPLLNLGIYYLERGEAGHAVEALQKAAALSPNSFDVLFHLGLAWEQAKNLREASQTYEKAVSVSDRREYRAHYNLAVLRQKEGKTGEAVRLYREVIRREPRHLEGLNNLGGCLELLGRPEEALAAFQAALAIDPAKPAILNNAGGILVRLKRYPEAERHLALALRYSALHRDPVAYTAPIHLNLGNLIYERDHDLQTATEEWQAAIQAHPAYLPAYRQMAVACERADQPRLARQCWQSILKKDPADRQAQEALKRLEKR